MISVIIPVYNTEPYLKDCIDSVLGQDYDDFEVICVNDGSTDGSLELLSSYAKNKKIKIISQANKGRSAARNAGIFCSSGNLICFVDSDDELKPNALKLLSGGLYPDVDAVVSSIEVTHLAHSERKNQDSSYYKIDKSCTKKISSPLLFNFHTSVCASLFRKKVILQNKIFFPIGLNYEDAFFHWTYFQFANKVSFLSESTYKYIRREGSIMSETFEGSEAAIDHLLIAEEVIKFYKQKKLFEPNQEVLLKLLSNYFWLAFQHLPSRERCTAISECARIIKEQQLSVTSFFDLECINTGNVGTFFQLQSDNNLKIAIEIQKLISKFFPNESRRNKLFFWISRKVYRFLTCHSRS